MRKLADHQLLPSFSSTTGDPNPVQHTLTIEALGMLVRHACIVLTCRQLLVSLAGDTAQRARHEQCFFESRLSCRTELELLHLVDTLYEVSTHAYRRFVSAVVGAIRRHPVAVLAKLLSAACKLMMPSLGAAGKSMRHVSWSTEARSTLVELPTRAAF